MAKSSEGSPAALRTEAIEYALLVNRFLDKKIFPTVLEAIEEKDTKGFEQICRKMNIPEKQIRIWTATAFAHSPPHYPLNEPGTKTSRNQTTQQIW